jgi:hypothetical protein
MIKMLHTIYITLLPLPPTDARKLFKELAEK